ncbi:response regulator [Dyadobacter subterraneus]|uniref:Response regulator transcription factor n=1 Tax=Dyadobacter subterraneus TaxID=2773304 RepID=A0ABR9WGR3_9BACT|nr:response regulator transcription factor [Dyadobacter subterraneus]MBE9463536.1 response regulator transcription factor [Dyadobacter subterraneus]
MQQLSQPLIAIVDDSAVVRTFTAFLLANYDFEVVFDAEDGQECIDKMHQVEQLPDIVILDIEMPVMDGFQAAAILKTNWPEVKIIAFSNMNDSSSKEKILAAGAEAFVTKESDITEKLIDIINKIWQQNQIRIES